MSHNLTRKTFLGNAAKYTAGISAGVVGFNLLSADKSKAESQAHPWPWPYAKLDLEHVRILGHDSFWKNACAYATFNALVQALAEEVGEPFTLIPTELMIYGHGGAAGWGTLCGALNGASAAISLVHDKTTSDKLVNELIGWYTQTEFPSAKSNEYASNNMYSDNRYEGTLPQNLCGSPLCHISVTEWCLHSGYKVSDIERKERCARLAGDVAAKAAELLNQEYDSQFASTYTPPEEIGACMSCHGANFANNVAAKMACMQCHGDPHMATAVERREGEGRAASFALKQTYPNPFNPVANVEFSVPEVEKLHLAVYDVRGRLVRTLVDHELYSPGSYALVWDGKDNFGQRVATGVYFTKMRAGRFAATQKMTLAK